ncbi:hypothetical protein FXO38_09147 [Capsicum annuum]|nr:hypothetical protein FXO37_15093 [Capsicum annuum]KAF3666289.1 hypothetical protein FXO38_09147 [Capsicum annuum]
MYELCLCLHAKASLGPSWFGMPVAAKAPVRAVKESFEPSAVPYSSTVKLPPSAPSVSTPLSSKSQLHPASSTPLPRYSSGHQLGHFKSEEDKSNNFNKNQAKNDGSNPEISRAALQAEDKVPPPLACDDRVLNEIIIFVKDRSMDIRRPNEATWLFALSPPNEFNPLMYLTLVVFWKDFLSVPTMVVEPTVAAENVAIVAIVF